MEININKFASEEVLKPMVEKAIENYINNEVFGRYGTVEKKIKETLDKLINIDLSKVSFQTYNEAITNEIERRINEFHSGLIADGVKKLVDTLTGVKKERVSLSDFFDKQLDFAELTVELVVEKMF